jgi:hypothetical protein
MLFDKLRRAFGPAPLKAGPGRAEPRPDGRNVLGLSMVKNEQDIIEPFIRHHARLLDALVILDNASLDETRRIAMDCARELGNVAVADSDEFGYAQAERMTRLLHGCQSAFFADFVLFLDADEFLSTPDRPALLRNLDAIPPGGVGHLPWRTFVLKPGEDAAATPDPRGPSAGAARPRCRCSARRRCGSTAPTGPTCGWNRATTTSCRRRRAPPLGGAGRAAAAAFPGPQQRADRRQRRSGMDGVPDDEPAGP